MAHGTLLRALWEQQKRRELTNRALAAEIGVHEAAISRYQSGVRVPETAVIQRIVQRYPELLGYLLVSDDSDGKRPEVRAGSGPSPPR